MEKHSVLIMAPEGISLLRCKDDLIEMLGSKGIYRTTAKHQCRYMDVETDHVAIRIIPYDFKDFDGMRYDECFGVPPHISCRMGRQLIDAPDYICQVEREASAASVNDLTKKALYELFEKYIRLHNIPAQFHRDYENGREYRLIIEHKYKLNTAIHILWDEVKDIDELHDAVIRELKKWSDYENKRSESAKSYEVGECVARGLGDGLRATLMIDEMSTYPCDLSRKQIYISTAGTDYDPFYKYLMNAVYGKCPERNAHWVQEVFSEAAKNGTIKPKLTKFTSYTKEEIDKMFNQPIFNLDYYIQNQIYAALMKGENNMDKVMKDITLGKPAYLATENGRVPVRIETCTMSTLEPARFEGHVLTLADTLATYYSMSSGKRVSSGPRPGGKLPAIKTVHFSGPVTAVIWEDGTKTLVRCKEGEVPDYEKGFAMAIAKKALGTNKSGSNYYDIFKKYLPKPEDPIVIDYATAAKEVPVEDDCDG